MSLSDDLAATEAAKRQQRERQTAANAALQEVMRSGGGITQSGLERWAQERIDGTSMTFREAKTERAGSTNNADHLTHSATPIQSTREDS